MRVFNPATGWHGVKRVTIEQIWERLERYGRETGRKEAEREFYCI